MTPTDLQHDSPAAAACHATRTAILDAAEALFARDGVDGTSIRQITKEAGVNLAAVNYHFRTKSHLALEVYARRIKPLNEQRIALLDEFEREAGDQPVALEKILEALVYPVVRDRVSGHGHEIAFVLLMSRSLQEQGTELSEFVSQQFGYIVKRFDDAFLRAIPGLTKEELIWRMTFLFGALNHSLDFWGRYESHPTLTLREEQYPKPDCKEYARRLITFAAAGLRSQPFHP